jgi:hypothetical protein
MTGDGVAEVCCSEIEISIQDVERNVVVIDVKTDVGSVQIIGNAPPPIVDFRSMGPYTRSSPWRSG